MVRINGKRHLEVAEPEPSCLMSKDTYTATEASRLLEVSPRRVRQFIAEGVLEGVPNSKPLKIRAQSVHELRDERKKSGTNKPQALAVEIEERVKEARLEGIALGERSAQLAITAREESEKYLREALAQEQAERKEATEKLLFMASRIAELEAAEANKKRGLFNRK